METPVLSKVRPCIRIHPYYTYCDLDRFESDIIPALQREYPDVFDGSARGRHEIDVFKRKWVYY